MYIKFADPLIREYSDGIYLKNEGNPIEVTSLQAFDLLEVKTVVNGSFINCFLKATEAEVSEFLKNASAKTPENTGVVTPGSVDLNRSDGQQIAGQNGESSNSSDSTSNTASTEAKSSDAPPAAQKKI